MLAWQAPSINLIVLGFETLYPRLGTLEKMGKTIQMSILNIGSMEAKRARKPKKFKFVFTIAAITGVIAISSTLASNISLNNGVNVEFGQGVATRTACDNSISVTPVSTFINSPGATSHKFSGLSLSSIDSNSDHCDGKDFIIKAYSFSDIQDIFSNGGDNYNTLRVYDDGGDFSLVSDGSDSEEISSDNGNSGNLSSTSFTVTFNSPVASAEDIQRITIESVEHIETGLITYGTHTYQLISNEVSWNDAYIDITTPVDGHCKYQLNGKCGYFATITSDAERLAVIANVGDGALWLGGSDRAVEGTWRWIDGPELGENFSTTFEDGPFYDPVNDLDYYTRRTATQTYDHWNGGEPNESNYNEDALQTLSGVSGLWNDLPTSSYTLRYLIEYSPDFRSR